MKHLVTLFMLTVIFYSAAHPSAGDSQGSATHSILTENIGSVQGTVIDMKFNEPLPYVTVTVEDFNGDIITGGITDDNGAFKINSIHSGKYIVKVQYIGYKPYEKEVEITSTNPAIDLGVIKLEEDIASLDEITIVAEVSTIQQKVDRKVINVGKDLTTSGPTASEIMNNIPSVSVDQQTGDISMRGNQNVQVMVDGKISNVPASQLLKQIPSNSIKQIELITNPSAKYNPEGMSGIINIILHKNVNVGFNGNINVGLAYEIEPKFNSGIDLNYRFGKFNFYGNYSNNISKNVNGGKVSRLDENIDQVFDILDDRESHLFKVGVDFYLNDKNTLSVFTNQNIFEGETLGTSDILYNNEPSLNTYQTFLNNSENDSQKYNLNYKLELAKEGHTIELEADHNLFNGKNFTDNLISGNMIRPNFIENTDTEREQSIINLDYVNPLTETSKLETGLEARLLSTLINYDSNARSQNSEGQYIPSETNFDFTRDIYSAYVSYGKNLEKWTYQLGLRAEVVKEEAIAKETDLDSNSETIIPFTNDYFQLYPSVFFTYTASEKNSYQLSYSRRVDRPGIGQINPLPEWNTPLISSFGNQKLQPQFTNSIEANYTRQLEKGSVTGGVFFRLIEDEINRALFIDRADLNRLILSFDNFDNTTAYGIEVSGNYRPTKWWNLNGSFDLFSQTQKSIAERLLVPADVATVDDIVIETVSVDNIAWNIRLFNNFKVSDKLSFSAFGMYRGQNKSVQFNAKEMYFVNLGMRYNFVEYATFSLNFNDVFDTMRFAFEGERPYRQSGQFNWESQTVFAGLSFRFGGGKYRALSRKKRDSNEAEGGGGLF